MVGRQKRKSRSKKLVGNHQRSWIWGQHTVLETFRGKRWLPLEILFAPDRFNEEDLHELQDLTGQLEVSIQATDSDSLHAKCGASDHQGIIARMPEYPYAEFSHVANSIASKNAFVLLLDRIQDPFNFGSILRSAELFGVDAILIPKREQVGVTSHVARSSSGAVNHLEICRVESLIEVYRELKDTGFQIIAAAADGAISPEECDFSLSTALIIGNEGDGIDPELLEQATQNCAIPQTGKLNSLNAAVAAGILCYEVSRQRRQN